MARLANSYITQRRLGPLLHVRLSGTVDETFGLLQTNLGTVTAWVLDLAHIERVTSWGIQHWVEFMRQAGRVAKPLLFARAPPCVVDHLNMVEGFQSTALVLSVLAPYVCGGCQQRQLRPLVLAEHAEVIASGQAPVQTCVPCNRPLDFEDHAPSFFQFVASQPSVQVPTQAAVFNEWLCGPESTVEVEARFLAHAAGASLYTMASRTEPASQPARPARPQLPRRQVTTTPESAPTVLMAYLGANAIGARAAVLTAGYRHVARAADANVQFAPLASTAAAETVQCPTVSLFDGRLEARHAPYLKTAGRTLLLGCRDPAGAPTVWELRLLNRFLRRLPLLPPGSSETTYPVRSMDTIRVTSEIAGELATTHGGRGSARDIAVDVVYELMTNALIDAPVNARGEPKYAFQRDKVNEVDAGDECVCSLSVHQDLLFIRAIDHFGRLSKSDLGNAIGRAGMERVELDTSGGGAGLGLWRVLMASDAFVVSVVPLQKTEVCAVIRLAEVARRRDRLPKSLFIDAPQT